MRDRRRRRRSATARASAPTSCVHAGTVIGAGCDDPGRRGARQAAEARARLERAARAPAARSCSGTARSSAAARSCSRARGSASGAIVGDQAYVRERACVGAGIGDRPRQRGRQRRRRSARACACRRRLPHRLHRRRGRRLRRPRRVTTNDDTMARHAPAYALRGATLRRACRIGGGAVLCPGVEIGEEAFVAAGAVVTQRRAAARGRDGRPGARRARGRRRGPARALAVSAEPPRPAQRGSLRRAGRGVHEPGAAGCRRPAARRRPAPPPRCDRPRAVRLVARASARP